MAVLRHIAIAVADPEAAATFFETAFGMWRAGNAMRGIYMTDGTMNVALLDFKDEVVAGHEGRPGVQGVIHWGMWVDSLPESEAAITAAGGRYITGRQDGETSNPDVFYEVKYATPEGFVFDITETGWRGAVKDVVPAAEPLKRS